MRMSFPRRRLTSPASSDSEEYLAGTAGAVSHQQQHNPRGTPPRPGAPGCCSGLPGALFRCFCPDEDEVEARCMLAFSLLIGNHFMVADHGTRSPRRKCWSVPCGLLEAS